MRIVAWLGIVVLCLAVAGCSLFGRRGWRNSPVNQPGPGGPAPAAPAVAPQASQARIGLLAGRVVDNFDQKPPKTYIRVIDTTDPKGAPIDVEADASGYFTIQGLEERKQYRLIARSRDGERFMAGNTFATASHGNLVIRISEDFVVPGTPDVPDWPGGKMPHAEKGGNAPAGAWNSPNGSGGTPPVQLGTPTPNGPNSPRVNGPQGPAVQTPHRENIVQGQDQRADLSPRPAIIRNGPAPETDPGFPKITIPSIKAGAQRPAIPSCSGIRGKVEDFALNDLDGQPWEFRTNVRGKLVLLDFWGTWCPHCIAGMPELVDLQARYGGWGLDVVGIAYEHEGPLEEQVQQVKKVRDSRQLNYTLLLGSGYHTHCPVREYFSVAAYPTMVLLDRDGHILWRTLGHLDPVKKHQLETEIRNRLDIR